MPSPHLASGDIPVEYGTLAYGNAGIDETIMKMAEMAYGKWGARSPKIRAAAINIMDGIDPIKGTQSGWPVGDKDYYGMIKAIHNYVRDNIRYVKDVASWDADNRQPINQETLSYPEETLFNSHAEDCDGKSILEMALLGAIGIRSYPVVIGMQPDRYSHVYLNIVVPQGRTKYAGQVIPADPIMREWPLGKEAPADKVKAKKLYTSVAGLGPDMTLSGLGAYATGPSYLSPQDEVEASQVPAVLASRRTDATTRGRIPTTAEIHLDNGDELDQLFDREINQFPGQNTPKSRFYNRGPTVAQHAAVETSFLTDAQPMNISAHWKRLYVSAGNMTKGVQKAGQEMGPVVGELIGLADFVINGLGAVAKLCKGCRGVAGKNDPLHKISAAAHLAAHTAAKVKRTRIAYSAGLFGEGEDQSTTLAAIERLANAISMKADQVANLAAPSSERREMLRTNLGYLADLDKKFGVTDAITATPTLIVDGFNAPAHVELLTRVLSNPELLNLSRAHDELVVNGRLPGTSTIANPLHDDAVVEGREDSDLAGWGTNFRDAFRQLKSRARGAVAANVNAAVRPGHVGYAGNVQIPGRYHGPAGDAQLAGLDGWGHAFRNIANVVAQSVAKAPVMMVKTVALPFTAPIKAAQVLAKGGSISQAFGAAKNAALASVKPLTSTIQAAAPGKIMGKKGGQIPTAAATPTSAPTPSPTDSGNPCDPASSAYNAASCAALQQAQQQNAQNPTGSTGATGAPNMSDGTYNPACDPTSPSYNVTICQQAQAYIAQQQQSASAAQNYANQSATAPNYGSTPMDTFGPDQMGPASDEQSATSDGSNQGGDQTFDDSSGGGPGFDPSQGGGGGGGQSFSDSSSNFSDGSEDADSSAGPSDGGDGSGGSGPASDQGQASAPNANLPDGAYNPVCDSTSPAFNPTVCASLVQAMVAQGAGQSGGRRNRGSSSGDGSDDSGDDGDSGSSMDGILDTIKASPLLAVGAVGLGVWLLTRKRKRRA